jgi:FKBP-type peptidyl-prolyl cis-trans isomerase
MLSFAKARNLFLPLCALLLVSASCKKSETGAEAVKEAGPFKTETEKVSYILGFSTGKTFKTQSVDVDVDIFMRGLKEGIKDPNGSVFKQDEEQKIMQAFRENLMAKRKKEADEKGKKNAEEGEKFMAANKAKPGVVTTESGLQYRVITEGKGPKPVATDTVMVDYKGTLLDGTVFDTTEGRQPAALNLSYVVPGFSEALKLMPVGSKWEIFIPGSLGYGAREAAGGKIGPNQTLKFEIDLKEIKKEEKKPEEAGKKEEPMKAGPKMAPKMAPMMAPKK